MTDDARPTTQPEARIDPPPAEPSPSADPMDRLRDVLDARRQDLGLPQEDAQGIGDPAATAGTNPATEAQP